MLPLHAWPFHNHHHHTGHGAFPFSARLVSCRLDVSGSLETWIDMDVDYRAVATRASIAAVDPRNVWVATDTGMILKLTQ
jgi:hypothetical protein